jgi:hypothetical protein
VPLYIQEKKMNMLDKTIRGLLSAGLGMVSLAVLLFIFTGETSSTLLSLGAVFAFAGVMGKVIYSLET